MNSEDDTGRLRVSEGTVGMDYSKDLLTVCIEIICTKSAYREAAGTT